MKVRPEWSQRLLRKGVLVQETYELFAAWEDGLPAADNLKSALSGKHKTAGWEREVSATLKRRLRDIEPVRPLIALAKRGMSLAYMAPTDVHVALLRLHQYKRLNYEVAGNIAQVGLGCLQADD